MADETIYFFDLEKPFGCLSNSSRHKVYLKGYFWPTVEHYFQTSKFEDAEHRKAVREADTPGEARRRARQQKRDRRPNWHDIKLDVMRKTLTAKVYQHADVRAVLLSTEPARLVQRIDSDDYWGDGENRDGKNMLGRVWMQVRDRLTAGGECDELARALPPPWEKYPDMPRCSIGWRMGYGEAYMDEWLAFYYGLTPKGRQRYRELYPEPERWVGFYEDH